MRKNSKLQRLIELLPDDAEIILDEYNRFKDKVDKKNFPDGNHHYVYSLCTPEGHPFYIGKGSGMRAWDHLFQYIDGTNKSNQEKLDAIDHLVSEVGEYPIMFVIKDGMSHQEAMEFEKSEIEHYGRISDGGTLFNKMPGGWSDNYNLIYASIGGKIGGKQTRANQSGIFSPDYDRSATSKFLYHNVFHKFREMDRTIGGKIGGKVSVDNQLGIHDPKYSDKRSEWAVIGGKNVKNRKGCATKEWQAENKEQARINGIKGGHVGGSIVGKMFWWNNSIVNKKSVECPGEGWVRGMLMSEKKRAQVMSIAGHNRKTSEGVVNG